MYRNPHRDNLVKAFERFRYRHALLDVYRDFCELAAITISNRVDPRQADAREQRYLEIAGKYQPEEMKAFPELFGELVMALEVRPADILGAVFMQLELHNAWKGQFFTPDEICEAIGRMQISKPDAIIEQRGFVTVCEPACGGGAMLFGVARAMADAGYSYQRHMHATAIDVDITCVHMTYVQLSLLYIPAIVIHGNTLSLEEWSHWYTPAHCLHGWDSKLRRLTDEVLPELPVETAAAPETLLPALEPVLAGRRGQLALF